MKQTIESIYSTPREWQLLECWGNAGGPAITPIDQEIDPEAGDAEFVTAIFCEATATDYRRRKLHFTPAGRAYINAYRRRYYLDEICRF